MEHTDLESMLDDLLASDSVAAKTETLPFNVRPLSEIATIYDYFKSYGPTLGKKAVHALAPLHIPGRDELPDFDDIPADREPFDCQKHAIAATVKMLDNVRSGFICGEMGTGKTLMGIVGVHKHAQRSRNQGGKGGNYRALVLCPDHLINKWCREIEETIPGAKVTRFGSPEFDSEDDDQPKRRGKKKGVKAQSGTKLTLKDAVSLFKNGYSCRKSTTGDKPHGDSVESPVSTGPDSFEMKRSSPGSDSGKTVKGLRIWNKPQGAEWYVLGRNQAKWLSDWIGIADREPGFNGLISKNSVSTKIAVVKTIEEKNEYGRVTGSKKELGRVFCCPKCGEIIKDKKGVPVSEKTLSSETKGSSQLRCSGTYAVEIPDSDKAKHDGIDRLCPLPGRFAEKRPADKSTGKQADEFTRGGIRYKVMACNEPLYNYVSRPMRWSPARIIQKKMKRFFSYLVIDEVHEQKSDESAQSMACGKLIASVDHVIALTGTIIGGYANHLYPLMIRITPKSLREEGHVWGKDMAFNEMYGRIDKVIRTTEESGNASVGGNAKSMRKAKNGDQNVSKYVRPGVMPTMFGRHMIGSTMFITLEELGKHLPDLFEYIGGESGPAPDRSEFDKAGLPYEEAQEHYEAALDNHERSEEGWFDTAVSMLPNQAAEYGRVKSRLETENRDLLQRGCMKLLGAYLWTTMDYPDKPYGWGHDTEVKKAIAESGEGSQAPGLLGQAFLGKFEYSFEPATQTLVLTRTQAGVTETDRIPLRKEGGIYWLDVTFNGKHVRSLAYDTGASSISIPEVMAEEIGLKSHDGGQSQIADGSIVETKKAVLDSVTVGKFTLTGVECSIMPTSNLPHTVGYWDKPGDKKIDNWRGVVTPKDLPEDVIYPKEQALIDICKKQKADGTQTWVYVQMTGKRNVQPRLKKMLEAEGLKVGVLRSTDVEPIEREQWIAKNGRDFDVMISHPQLVSTGLDLFSKASGGHNYSTLVFYETGYNLFTMRQAARRAWRIGQPRDCRVYYLYYKETMQHNAMNLMSRKMAAAQALEGEFSEDGLAAMAGEDNLQMALAKSLADRIDDSDMQRSWGKVKSGPKKRKPGDALAKAASPTPSPFDGLPDALQLAGEALMESEAFKAAKPVAAEPEDDGFFDPNQGRFADPFADEAEDDDGFVMPELTPEILALMFKNMAAAGQWAE